MMRRFNPSCPHFKILHKNYPEFKTIGQVIGTNLELNLCKIQFTDRNGKIKKYWFHLFTGNVVVLPKKDKEWATDVPETSEKAYFISAEPVRPWDLNPELDMCYVSPKREKETDEDDEENNPKNSAINEIK